VSACRVVFQQLSLAMPDLYSSQVSTAGSCQGKWLTIRLASNRADCWQVRLYSDCNRGELSLAEAQAEVKLAILRHLKQTIVKDCPSTKVCCLVWRDNDTCMLIR
jgi:hypothetical protein